MKHLQHILMVSALLVLTSVATAQVVHIPEVWVKAGEHSLLLPSGSVAKASAGIESGVGFDYTLRSNHILMQVGVGLDVWHSTFRVPVAGCSLPGSVDRDGYEFTFVYDMQDRRDSYTTLAIELPLMMGGQFDRFRFLVGGRVIYNALSSTKAQMQISTYGDYPQFLDPFTGMPEHQFFEAGARSYSSHLPSGLDVAVSAEAGYQLTDGTTRPQMVLSLYADFGLLNYCRTRSNELLRMPDTFVDEYPERSTAMIDGVEACSLVTTSSVADGIIHNLGIGLKLSIGFPTASRHKRSSHEPCRCWDD